MRIAIRFTLSLALLVLLSLSKFTSDLAIAQTQGFSSAVPFTGGLVYRDVFPAVNNTLDLGTAALRFRTGRFDTSVISPIVSGGTTSGANLQIKSTEHATKGLIRLGTNAVYDDLNGELWLGATTPLYSGYTLVNLGSTNLQYVVIAGNLDYYGATLYLPLGKIRLGLTAGGDIDWVTDGGGDIGHDGAERPNAGYFKTLVKSPLFDAATGFRVAGAAPSGNYLRGDGTNFVSSAILPGDLTVTDAMIIFSDVTTNDVSTDSHGFAPKLPGDDTVYLNGNGEWTKPNDNAAGIAKVYAIRDEGYNQMMNPTGGLK